MSDELDAASFNKNYKILRETADWLSNQKEPDIDRLVPRAETAMKAYQICKDRLDKVQATLGQYFEPTESGTSNHSEPRRSPRIAATDDDFHHN